MKRLIGAVLAVVAAVTCGAALGQAAAFPAKPVRIVIPYPPGGSVDNLARAVAAELGKLWGQPVVVDGKPGAGGVTAAVAVATAPPDGHTVYLTDQAPFAITPFMQKGLPFDPMKDFAPVIALVKASGLVVVAAGSPINSISDLIAAAKLKPGAINYGSWGVGSVSHLGAEDFATVAGISMTHVPYKGAADMTRALLAGEIHFAFHSLSASAPQIKQGRLKAIAYSSLKRSGLLPDVPTIDESGMPGFEQRSWLGIVAPSATPRTVLAKIAADTARVLSTPAFNERYVNGEGFELLNVPLEGFAAVVEQTRVKTEAQLRRLKLRVE
jgi:tripartite-type tricarboxylate transporter receptor subunit TctC